MLRGPVPYAWSAIRAGTRPGGNSPIQTPAARPAGRRKSVQVRRRILRAMALSHRSGGRGRSSPTVSTSSTNSELSHMVLDFPVVAGGGPTATTSGGGGGAGGGAPPPTTPPPLALGRP